jgi:hypothetical protein
MSHKPDRNDAADLIGLAFIVFVGLFIYHL